jgi:hypothetical protein
MEGWNTGFIGTRSNLTSDEANNNLEKDIIRFLYPIFHISTIPLFH